MSDGPPLPEYAFYQFSIFQGLYSDSFYLLVYDPSTDIVTGVSTDGDTFTAVDQVTGAAITGQNFYYVTYAFDGAGYPEEVRPWPDAQAAIDAIEANNQSASGTPLTEVFYYTTENDFPDSMAINWATLQFDDIVYGNNNQSLYSSNPVLTPGASMLVEGFTVHEGVASWQTTDADDRLTVKLTLTGLTTWDGSSAGTLSIDPAHVGSAANTGETIVLDNTSAVHTLTISGTIAQINADLAGLVYTGSPDGAALDALQVDSTNGTMTASSSILAEFQTAACYCPGTLIRTPDGATPVEALRIGDPVMTLHGGTKPIRWIGRRSYDGRFVAGKVLMLPVCLKQGAIADNVPSRDLWVSAGHAIHLDGVLVPAWLLVNGVSIIQPQQVDRVSYLHVELDEHEVIFAEDCAAETFLDDACRGQFQNAAEYAALYADSPARSVVPCAPRVEDGFLLQSIQRRLAQRAGIVRTESPSGRLRGFVDRAGPDIVSGWAQDRARPEEPVCLDILVDGRRVQRVLANRYRADLRKAGLGSGRHAFTAPLPADLIGRIEVRRTADRSVLPLTEMARADVA